MVSDMCTVLYNCHIVSITCIVFIFHSSRQSTVLYLIKVDTMKAYPHKNNISNICSCEIPLSCCLKVIGDYSVWARGTAHFDIRLLNDAFFPTQLFVACFLGQGTHNFMITMHNDKLQLEWCKAHRHQTGTLYMVAHFTIWQSDE